MVTDVPPELWSDHEYVEFVRTSKKRAAKKKEIDERRIRLRDPFDVKFTFSKTMPYREALVEHSKLWSQKPDIEGKSVEETMSIYRDNAFLCPCQQFKHWNDSLIMDHINNHQEFKDFKESLWRARS